MVINSITPQTISQILVVITTLLCRHVLHSRAISSHTCARVPEHAGGPRRCTSSCGKRRAHGPARLRALGVGACDHAESIPARNGQHGDTRVACVGPTWQDGQNAGDRRANEDNEECALVAATSRSRNRRATSAIASLMHLSRRKGC
jgi:hypothetical protein